MTIQRTLAGWVALILVAALLVATVGTWPGRQARVPLPRSPVTEVSVSIAAVGDILMHQDVQRSADETAGGLRALWTDVEPLLRRADLAFANLETPVAPSSGQPGRPFRFNAPAQLPAALRESGFKVLSTANNHAYDQGAAGVTETLDRLKAEQLVAVGSGASRREAEQVRIIQVKGLRVAFLGFTDLFNINLNRRGNEPWVCPLDPEAAVRAVRAARTQADAVVVSIHWGVEYEHEPLRRQREVAERLSEAGADLILGTHPHVLQPVEMLARGGHRTLVAYSLGNFISNQDRMYLPDIDQVDGGDSRDGVVLQCRLVKSRQPDGSERVQVVDPVCEPLWNLNNWREYMSGEATRRVIRVLWVNAAIAAGRKATPGDGPGGLSDLGLNQHLLQVLQLRRERAAQCLGPAFVRLE
jgi:poly-gamma-glutamate synthesis protein (capsule biosynthesis protein)